MWVHECARGRILESERSARQWHYLVRASRKWARLNAICSFTWPLQNLYSRSISITENWRPTWARTHTHLHTETSLWKHEHAEAHEENALNKLFDLCWWMWHKPLESFIHRKFCLHFVVLLFHAANRKESDAWNLYCLGRKKFSTKKKQRFKNRP